MATSTQRGSCHCGAVRYTVEADLSEPGITCNCSICSRSGTILSFVPAGAFQLDSGEDQLTDYTFNKGVIHHLFCKTCGTKSFARGVGPDGSEMVAINHRCLDGFDPGTANTTAYDGRNA